MASTTNQEIIKPPSTERKFRNLESGSAHNGTNHCRFTDKLFSKLVSYGEKHTRNHRRYHHHNRLRTSRKAGSKSVFYRDCIQRSLPPPSCEELPTDPPVSYTHLRAHETPE